MSQADEASEGAKMGGGTHRFHLGVDAGATRCRARLRALDGAALAEAEGPAANAYVNFERAVEVARGLVGETLRRAGLASKDTSSVQLGLGVAGVGSAEEAERFASRFAGFAGVRVVNDAVAACVGAHGGADGGLIVVGTGSAGVVRVEGRETIVGGRGFHLGDDGSAARLGLEAARAAMRAADGLGPESDLTRRIRARFSDDALAMLHWAAKAAPRDYGEFAPLAIAAATAGDPVARGLVDEAASAVATLARRVQALGAWRLAMVGGLGEAIRPFLAAELSARLRKPMFDPTDGAIALVGGVLPAPVS
jgi:glucosamine kinase